MRKTAISVSLLALLVVITSYDAAAQAFNRRKKYNTVSVHLNAMNYFGDLVPKTSFTSIHFGSTRPNLGFTYSHRLSPRLSWRGGIQYGRIAGDDKKAADKGDGDASYRYYRNLSFRNDIIEISGVGMVDLLENRGTYLKRRDWAPYLFAGFGFVHHNPKGLDNRTGNWVALQPLGTEGQQVANPTAGTSYPTPYKRLQIVVPFGIGVRYKLDRQYDIGFEIGWRKTFTDYLDDVSGKYAKQSDLSADAQYFADRSKDKDSGGEPDINNPATALGKKYGISYGKLGQQRGTDNEDDWYIVSGFSFSYILTPSIKSPKFR